MPLRQRRLPAHDAGAEAALKHAMALPAATTDWGIEALRQQLEPLLPGLSIEVLAEATSTNTLLLERARVDRSPCLLVAETQTAGRGRLGREWVSQAGGSLTFSLALPLAPRSWSGLSLAVGLALADALEALDGRDAAPAAPVRIGLKWPNDLCFDGRKLGGILIETVVHGDQRIVVVGIGLNVMPQPLAGTACLHEIDGELPNVSTVLTLIAAPLVRALLDFSAHGFEAVAAAYAKRDVLRGRAVRTTAPGVAEGVAEGVDADGALCVRVGSQVQRVLSGEVSVRLTSVEAAAC